MNYIPENFVEVSKFNDFTKDIAKLTEKYGLKTKADLIGNISRYIPDSIFTK